jgi:chromosome segregation ATPase
MREIPAQPAGPAIRRSFLRPWKRRDAAIANLQQGFDALTGLMGAIRDHLERQEQRQDSLLATLHQLPQALESIPENSRVQSETLRAIRQQIEYNSAQQEKLAEILRDMGQTDGQHKESIQELRQRMEALQQHDQAIADNLSSVGSAMQSVSRNSQSSAEILQQIRGSQAQRDGQIEQLIERQRARFTAMLAVAMFLAIAALAAVSMMGYWIWKR